MSQKTLGSDAKKMFHKNISATQIRLFISILVGLIIGICSTYGISWKFFPLIVWDIAGLVFLLWTWIALDHLTSTESAKLAQTEDPGRTATDIVLIFASIASLVAVGFLLVQASHAIGSVEVLEVSAGVASVIISWAIIHTVYALRYTRMYYIANARLILILTRILVMLTFSICHLPLV